MYLSANIDTIKAGLKHHMNNLKVLINYAHKNNYILIIPKFHLISIHNNGKTIKSNMSKYYNYDKIKIAGKLIKVVFSNKNINKNDIIHMVIKPQAGLIRLDDRFKIRQRYVLLPFNDNIINISNKIISKLGNYTCIHVRRGDIIKTNKMNTDTNIENILRNIRLCNLKNVYIMTNEKIKFFENLKKTDFNINFYTDFDSLKNIIDNYYLYCIEQQIMIGASKRVSTFKMARMLKNGYYTSSLMDIKGNS